MTAVPDKSVFSWTNIGISVFAGAAAAAVFAVLARGGFGALLLGHFAPLPLMIVALGFGIRHGATSAIVATLILTIWPHPMIGMAYGLLIALPAWLAAYAASGAPWGRRDLLTTHLPGWATLAPAATLAAVVILWIFIATLVFGSFDEALNPIRARAFIVLDQIVKSQEYGEKFDPTTLSGVVARAMPAVMASYLLLLHALNLWIAGRLSQLSGLLTRPWPDIAKEYMLPRQAAAVFVAGIGLSFLDGVPGAVGLALALTLGIALAFEGLAVTHELLRGSKSSALVLSVIYFMLGLLGWPMALFALLGAADTHFNYRDRKKPAPQEPRD